MSEIIPYLFLLIATLAFLHIIISFFGPFILIWWLETYYVDSRGCQVMIRRASEDDPFKVYTETHEDRTIIYHKGSYNLLYKFFKGPKRIYRKSKHPELLI
jgi:hypothetical protein